jgi:hypothetical protein
LELDPAKIYSIFEQYAPSKQAGKNQKKTLPAIMACGILAEMLSMGDQKATFVLQKFTGSGSSNALGSLATFIDIN